MIRLGSFFAWGLVVLGGFPVGIGFLFVFSGMPEDGAEFARHYFNMANTGEMIDRGLIYIVIGVVVGLLARIAKNTTTA